LGQHEILFIIFSYLLGSVPFGFIFFYIIEKKDIRKHGSGNIGTANILRNKGKTAAITTLIFDLLKGILPIIYGLKHFNSNTIIILGGAAAIIGHVFSVFLKFKSGKGVATFCGVFLAFCFPSMIVFVIFFLITLIITKYISAASMIGTISLFFFILFTHVEEISMIVLILVILIIAKHHSNLNRIFNGTENKFKVKNNG
jgi:glycerol-3-phosphate acyltransferase PlsY